MSIVLTPAGLVRLVNAPRLEAAEIVEKLGMRDDKTLKLALFSLQRFIRVRSLMLTNSFSFR